MNTLIEECLAEIDDMCILFIKDDWSAANAAMGSVLNKLQKILENIRVKQQELNRDKIENYSLRFFNIVEVVNQAMEDEDGIQISDLMGYDMRDLLLEYKNEMETV